MTPLDKSVGSARIIVCGGRHYGNSGRVALVLEEYFFQRPTIVHGGATGADRLAGQEARALRYPVEEHPADWTTHGKAAGPIRNQAMVDAGADLLIAFGGGAGTADCIRRARKAGIPVREEER